MIEGIKDAIRFVLALILITVITLSIAYCTQETIEHKYNDKALNI
jgi:hypothetical protein|tara:strand:+ start:379 stop:513 length:135 start_codon:yes stop_codon:yes gene_type:complete